MKGTHMSGRDLIYRDLSCWPTPLHYHPAHACGPFYLTLLHSLPPCLPSVSRSAPPPTLTPNLYVCPTVCHSHFLCISFVCATRPNGFALASKIYFLLQKQKGHAADCMRLVLLCKYPTTITALFLLVAGAGKAPSCIFISAR